MMGGAYKGCVHFFVIFKIDLTASGFLAMTKRLTMYDKSNMPRYALSRPHLHAIGLVAAEWAALEESVHSAIFRISGVDYQKLAILTYRLGASTLMDILIRFVDASPEFRPRKPTLKKLLDCIIDPLRMQRNDIVHTAWYAVQTWNVGGGGSLSTPKPTAYGNAKRRSGEQKHVEFTPKQMRTVAKQINHARRLFEAVIRGKLTQSQRKLLV